MINKNFLITLLKVILTISMISCIIILFSYIIGIFMTLRGTSILSNMVYFLKILNCIVYILIIHEMFKLSDKMKLNLFDIESSNIFKKLGYYVVILAGFDAVLKMKTPSNIQFIYIPKVGSLKETFLIYLIIGVLFLVLSKTFRDRFEVNNEDIES